MQLSGLMGVLYFLTWLPFLVPQPDSDSSHCVTFLQVVLSELRYYFFLELLFAPILDFLWFHCVFICLASSDCESDVGLVEYSSFMTVQFFLVGSFQEHSLFFSIVSLVYLCSWSIDRLTFLSRAMY